MNVRALIISVIVFLLQCNQNLSQKSKEAFNSDNLLKIVEEDSIFLQWDKPLTTCAVTSYKVLYRPHNSKNWISLNKKIIAKDSPYVCIYRKEISDTGMLLDFAVRAYFDGGDSSNISYSTDSVKAAYGGWYLKW